VRIFYETHFAPLLRMQGYFNEVALDLVTRGGDRLPVLVNAAERRDADGTHALTRLTIFNATDRRRYERTLVEARAAAEHANRSLQALNAAANASLLDERAASALREQFIAVLGHDLRNPLAAIANASHLLLALATDPRSVDAVQMIQRSVARMAGLIDDVLDFARGRLGGGLTLDRHLSTSLESMLLHVVAELRSGAPERTIDVRFELVEPVDCDDRRIGQLLSNLLANALTYGSASYPIRVSATAKDGQFELFVENGGDPVPAKVLESLFQPFSRTSDRPSRQGLGLGLYIAHEIAVAHGGELIVTSDPTVTRFTFQMSSGR
jgi:phosphoserine phosphatase RsbU/P